jgi:hypothetical protein
MPPTSVGVLVLRLVLRLALSSASRAFGFGLCVLPPAPARLTKPVAVMLTAAHVGGRIPHGGIGGYEAMLPDRSCIAHQPARVTSRPQPCTRRSHRQPTFATAEKTAAAADATADTDLEHSPVAALARVGYRRRRVALGVGSFTAGVCERKQSVTKLQELCG